MKEGWEYKKLGEVCDISSARRVRQSDWKDSGVPFYRAREIVKLANDGTVENELFISEELFNKLSKSGLPKEGDLMISAVGTLGATYIVKATDRFYYKDASVIRISNIKSLISEYLRYLFSSNFIIEQIQKQSQGATVGTITISNANNFIIPVPPLTEQKRIVEELDLLSGIIEKQKQQLKELDTLAQSIFYDMFGDPVTNEKGWEVKKLEAVCKIICGQDHKPVKDESGKYPIYGSGGFMGFASQYRCPENTVIIGRKGNINNPIFVDQKFWNIDTAFGIVSDKKFLYPLFFFYFCRNYDFTKHDVSVTIPSLRRTDVLKITVPIPPLVLQNLFASKIEAIEKQKETITKSIEETQKLFDYTMDKYFG